MSTCAFYLRIDFADCDCSFENIICVQYIVVQDLETWVGSEDQNVPKGWL